MPREKTTGQKILRRLLFALIAYVLLVVAFESMIGFLQPSDASTLSITTFDASGDPHPRIVSRLETDGKLYVAANHWPRAWYGQALDNPRVEVVLGTEDGEPMPYRAVPVEGPEFERVDGEHSLPLGFRFITGFPPRRLVRLDPL